MNECYAVILLLLSVYNNPCFAWGPKLYGVPQVPAESGADAVITCFVKSYYSSCTPESSNTTCRISFSKNGENITSDGSKYEVENMGKSDNLTRMCGSFLNYSFTDALKEDGYTIWGSDIYESGAHFCYYSTLTIKGVDDQDFGNYTCHWPKGSYYSAVTTNITLYDANNGEPVVEDTVLYFESATMDPGEYDTWYRPAIMIASCVYISNNEDLNLMDFMYRDSYLSTGILVQGITDFDSYTCLKDLVVEHISSGLIHEAYIYGSQICPSMGQEFVITCKDQQMSLASVSYKSSSSRYRNYEIILIMLAIIGSIVFFMLVILIAATVAACTRAGMCRCCRTPNSAARVI